MKTILPQKMISTFLLCIAIFSSSFAQTLEIVENQPDYDLAYTYETDNNFVFINYYGEIDSSLYTFNGINFGAIDLEEDFGSLPWFLGEFQGKYYFTHYGSPTDLIEYDGSQVILYEFPENFENPVFLGKFNNKFYVVGQDFLNGDAIFGFNGSELEEYEVPDQMELLDYYFSEQNQLLYLMLTDHQGNGLKPLWIFDGVNYIEIPDPQGKEFISFNGEINGTLVLGYRDMANSEDISLYKLDGTNLLPIINPENTFFSSTIGSNEQELFLRYENLATGKGQMYVFNGNSIVPIYTSTDKDAVEYLGTINNEEYFTFFNSDDTELLELYRYNNSSFTHIEGPEGFNFITNVGSTDEKMYLIYTINAESEIVLAEVPLGGTKATLLPNPLDNYNFYNFQANYKDTMFYKYESESEENVYKLVSLGISGFKEVDTAENLINFEYQFTLNNEVFFSCFNQQIGMWQLYKINGDDLGVLEKVETSQNITVSPNPAKEYFKIHFTDAISLGEVKVNLFSISGKLINTQDFSVSGSNPEILYPTKSLTSGVYVLEVVSVLGKVTKRVVVQ